MVFIDVEANEDMVREISLKAGDIVKALGRDYHIQGESIPLPTGYGYTGERGKRFESGSLRVEVYDSHSENKSVRISQKTGIRKLFRLPMKTMPQVYGHNGNSVNVSGDMCSWINEFEMLHSRAIGN